MGGMEMEGEMEAKPPGAQGVPVPVIRKKGTTLYAYVTQRRTAERTMEKKLQ